MTRRVAAVLSALLLLGSSAAPPSSPPADAPVLTLAEALELARTRNLHLKVAEARLAQAGELSARAWSAFLPHVSAGAAYTYNPLEIQIDMPAGYNVRYAGVPMGPGMQDPEQPESPDNPPGFPSPYFLYPMSYETLVLQRRHQFGAQARVDQALLAPMAIPALHHAALARKAAGLGVENARREVLFAVAQLYFAAAGLRESLAVQDRLLELARAHEADAEKRVKNGAAPRVALLRAQLDRTRAEQDALRGRNAYAGARSALATLLNREEPFDVVLPPDVPLPPDVEDWERAAGARPDVEAARTGLELARSVRATDWTAYAPNLGLSAQYQAANVRGFAESYGQWAFSVGLSWTLFDGGLRESARRENAAKLAEAEAAARSAELKAREEVRRAVLDLASARANRVKADEQLRLARESAELSRAAFTVGVATYLEVSEAHAGLLGAELGRVSEHLAVQLAALSLLKAAGALQPPGRPAD